ncbi:hypothetical protein GCM10009662_11070 [Catellatospora coxensis]
MKIAGVSLIAAARPVPMPAHRLRPLASSHASASTSATRTRLTWPKLTVSRAGCDAASRHAATPKVNSRGHPCSRAIGSTSQYSTSAQATAVSATFTAMAVCQPSMLIGSITTAANGGYVKP